VKKVKIEVIFDDNGKSYSDAAAVNLLTEVPKMMKKKKDLRFHISTETAFNVFRILVKEGAIPHKDIIFTCYGEDFPIEQDGTFKNFPSSLVHIEFLYTRMLF